MHKTQPRLSGYPRNPSYLICLCGNKQMVSAALPRRMGPVSRAIIIIITIMRSGQSLFVVIIIVVNIFSPFSLFPAIVVCRHDGTLRRTCAGNGHEVSACRVPGWVAGSGKDRNRRSWGGRRRGGGAVTDVANRDAG